MKTAVRRLLREMQVDLTDENFKKTPERVERMWRTFLEPEGIKITDFPLVKRGGMIVLRKHREYGFCPHHLLPVYYTFSFGYLPRDRRVLGASKPLRVFTEVLKNLPIQEDIGPLVLRELKGLQPLGMGVLIKGEHLCMRMRGVQSPCCDMITDCMEGLFLHSPEVRKEFLTLCKLN